MDLQEGKSDIHFIHLHVEASESILHLTLLRFQGFHSPWNHATPRLGVKTKKLVGACSPTHLKYII